MKNILHILLVEDDLQDVEIISEMLIYSFERPCNLQVKSSLSDAITACKTDEFDIILTDLGLPDSIGIETFMKLNEENPSIPIIVLTGLNNDNTGLEAVQSGAQDYLVKGEFQGETLNRCILYAIERKRAEFALEASEAKYKKISARLTETNNIKELLLDIITHDLKNSVAGIHGLSNILKKRTGGDDVVDSILEASERLTKVIDNSATLAKISCNEEIEKTNLDLEKILNEVIQEYAMLTEFHDMEVQCNSNIHESVLANPIIAEVFKNYFSNAVKYASDGGKIIVDADSGRGKVLVRISDLGKTIPVKERERIFERRIQLNGNKGNGSGLGLAIVKRIAEIHNGSVWVEQYNDRGNSFCLELPMN